jgi:hypothetical protein
MKFKFFPIFLLITLEVLGQKIITKREVFDLQVGDEFQYYNRHPVSPSGFRKRVLQKRISDNKDTVQYHFWSEYYFKTINFLPGGEVQTHLEFTRYNSSLQVFDLDSPIVSMAKGRMSGYHSFSDTTGYSDEFQTYTYGASAYRDKGNLGLSYGIGLGQTMESNYYDGWYLYWYLKCYISRGYLFGIPDNTYSLNNITSNKQAKLMIFPNPVTSKLYFNRPLNEKPTISIWNCQGVLVKEFHFDLSLSEIDVSELPPGLYLIYANAANENFYSRFIKE